MTMTNNIRIYLWIALAAVLYFNYQAWMQDYGPRPEIVTNTGGVKSSTPGATWGT